MIRAIALLAFFASQFHVTATATTRSGETRILICRGKPGIDLKVTSNPSPKNPADVRMTLRYGISPPPVGVDDSGLQPGTCTWNEMNYGTIPREPGYVTFDIHPLVQKWFETGARQMDTTVNAAAFFTDTISIRRYLSSPDNYWRFFVDDATNFSDSHNPTKVRVTSPTLVTVIGSYPFTSLPPEIASQTTTEKTSPETATRPNAPLAKLTFRRLVRRRDGFNVLFSARPNAAVSVSYSTTNPIKTPQGYYFPGAVVQGSGAVSRGGFNAEVSKTTGKTSALYNGGNRLPIQRGTVWYYLLTVEGNGPLEQFVGSFKSMQQDVTVTISNLTVTRSSVKQSIDKGAQVFANKGGSFVYCNYGNACQNAPDIVGLLVYAVPNFSPDNAPTNWSATPGKNSGVGKITIDTRMISMDRPFRSFTVTSLPGDIEFEAIGEIRVTWH